MSEFYDSALYARTAWLTSTRVTYILLAIINPLILTSVAWLSVKAIQSRLTRKKSEADKSMR